MKHKTSIGEKFISEGLEYVAFANPYSQSAKGFTDLIKAIEKDFIQLLKEAPEYRSQWEIAFKGQEPDLGLLESNSQRGKDRKFLLHDKDFTLEKHLIEKGVPIKKYAQLLSNMRKLQAICLNTSLNFTNRLDVLFPGYEFAKNFHKAKAQNTLRLIAYQPAEHVDDVIARAHTDRCAFTLHIYQSDPGLVFQLPDGTNKPFVAKPGTTAIFPGKKMQVMTGGSFSEKVTGGGQIITDTKGKINALPHYVKAEDPTKMRISFVYFAHSEVEVPHML